MRVNLTWSFHRSLIGIPKVLAEASGKDLSYACPKGAAFVTETNETLTCNPRAR
jgi:hypothetical protein